MQLLLDSLPILLIIGLFLLFLRWVFRKLDPPAEVDESLKAKSEAYAKWMNTKSDEDYQKYLELREERKRIVEERGYQNIWEK